MIDLAELRARAEASKLKTVDEYGLVQLTGMELLELVETVSKLQGWYLEEIERARALSSQLRAL